MAENFDPYQQWLGIGPDDLPADHYLILGLARFESDLQKIALAADERMSLVRSFQTGRRGKYTQQILNELSAAKVCLTTPSMKSAYDADLKRQLSVSLSGVFPELPPGAELPPSATASGAPAPFAWSHTPPQAAPAVGPTPNFATPVPQQPTYGVPPYVVPTYGAPAYNPAANAPPAYGAPGYAPPGYANPFPATIPTAVPVAAPVATPVTQPFNSPVVPPPPPQQPRVNFAPQSPVNPPPIVVAPPVSAKKAAIAPAKTTASAPAPTPVSAAPTPQHTQQNEEQDSLFARPWFPAAIVGGIVLVLGTIWFIRTMRNPPTTSEMAAVEDAAQVAVEPTEENLTEKVGNQKPAKQVETVIAQEGDSGVNFPPQLALIHGQKAELQVRGEEYVIGNWVSREDSLTWRFHIVKPNVFKAQLSYLAADDAAGGQYAIAVDGEERIGDIRTSDPPGQWVTDELFIAVKRAGEHRLTLRPVHKPGSELMTLKSLRLSPYNSGKEKPKEPSE